MSPSSGHFYRHRSNGTSKSHKIFTLVDMRVKTAKHITANRKTGEWKQKKIFVLTNFSCCGWSFVLNTERTQQQINKITGTESREEIKNELF